MRGLLLLLLPWVLAAGVFRTDLRPENIKGDRIGSIRILDQRELLYGKIAGRQFSEISDLAYLKKHRWLFMISDEGELFRFKARFDARKILELTPMDADLLRKKSGKKLKKRRRDSEGLTLDERGRLYLSFEGKPRVARIAYDGRIFSYLKLPSAIDRAKKMWRRNKGLEALAWHPRYGLLTAPEYPVKGASRELQTIYALSGKRWSYGRGKEPNSAITALEVLDNGNLLILERSYAGLNRPVVVTLRELELDRCGGRRLCSTRVLARLDSSKGWAVENFEGLAKVGPDHFLMISDDNDNFFQRTILVYFEVTSNVLRVYRLDKIYQKRKIFHLPSLPLPVFGQ